MKQFVILFILLLPALAFGQRRDQFDRFSEKNYFGIQFDDDFLFLGNRDEQYTGGLEFEYIHTSHKRKEKRGLFNPFSNGQRYWTAAFGSYLYTPYNVSDSLIILNDRPFSSYIYTSVGYNAYSPEGQHRLAVEFYLGIMGSTLPGKVQAAVHTVGESPPTFGWDHRIAQEEILIPNLRVNYQKNCLTLGRLNATLLDWFQFGSIFELNTGLYVNNLTGGVKISAFNHQPDNLSAKKFRFKPRKDIVPKKRNGKIKFMAYFMPQLQLVAQNTSLQSLKWLDSPYTIPTDEMNRHVWILETGVSLKLKRFYLGYMVQARSKEFHKYQEDWHTWAGLTIGSSF